MGLERWIAIAGLVLAVVGLLPAFSPFRRYIDRFNYWYVTNEKERARRRLDFVRRQLHDILDGTSHLHFQKSISGGLLAMAVDFALAFVTFILRRGDTGSAAFLILMAFGAAIWQFGSAFSRMNGIREQELRERIEKLERQLQEFEMQAANDRSNKGA